MAELRPTEITQTQLTKPSRRQMVAGLGVLTLGSVGILASPDQSSAQSTESEVDADRYGRGRRNRNRRRNRRRHRRHRD